MTRNLKRCYLLLVVGWTVAVVYFFAVTFPLVRRERELNRMLTAATQQLADAGHGMNSREVLENIEQIEADIAAFSKIAGDEGRRMRFPPEIRELLESPFQLLDYDYRKFLVIDTIRSLSNARGVALFPEWEQRFPLPGTEEPWLVWARLTMMDQILRTAIDAGVSSIDGIQILPTASRADGEGFHSVSLQIRLTGEMAAVQTFLTVLPLHDAELEALGLASAVDIKSSFFLDRFILRKSSPDHPGEVSLECVANGFPGPNPGPSNPEEAGN